MSDHDKRKKREREERRRTSDEQQEALRRRFAEAHAKGPVTGDGKRRPTQPRTQPWIELPNGERLYTDVLPEDASAYEAEDAEDVIRYEGFAEGFEDDVYGPNHRRRGGSWDIPGT
jgi:hypothetical protein